jgi:glycosyltransferase involved in cell wall biosynthesis
MSTPARFSLSKPITIICDPLLSEYGPTRPPLLLSKALTKRGYAVNLISVVANKNVKRALESHGIKVSLTGGMSPFKSESLTWFYFWLWEGFLSANSRKLRRFGIKTDGTVLNFSNTIVYPCHVWYAQGPPTMLMDNIRDQLSFNYRIAYMLSSQMLRKIDRKMTRKFSEQSKLVFANSKHLANIYDRWKVKVHGVIYPPVDCQTFKPATDVPSGDYAVAYFGKETDFYAIRKALDNGIRIKAFGGKMETGTRLLKHPNLEHLGRISDSKLIELYSNALFTLFPFTDEPFGYIPVESMACGTPVITYRKQGPAETVVDGVTGWLARDEDEIIELASKIWRKEYPKSVRQACRKRSLTYDISSIVGQWLNIIENA